MKLLYTKLSLPQVRTTLVPRPHLLGRLDASLAHCALTLISAPAGSGKTTLLAEWLANIKTSRSKVPALAWFSLDEGDNDPSRFWHYSIAACQNIDKTVGISALAQLYSPDMSTLESIVTILINDIAQISHQCILIFEDYHLITSPSIHKSVSFLLEHLPANLHVVIATRHDPPLPLARMRARNALTELRTAMLRFSHAETVSFLNAVAGSQLSTDDILRLETQTEGWVAGLQLIALLLQGQQNITQFLSTFTGSHRHVAEYLIEEVVSHQSDEIQAFLLQTSILNRLTGSLCDALTGKNDGERMLEDLERANLFLMPLDEVQYWYRYHALFVEALRHHALRHFGEAHMHILYNKASLWYEQHGLLTDAIEAALSACDFPRAAALLEHFTNTQTIRYDLTLHRWLERLPHDLLYSYPNLCFFSAQMLFFSLFATPQRAAYLAPLETAEQLWRAEGNLHKVGSVYALRTLPALWSGDLTQVFTNAEQALQLLPAEDIHWRSISLATAGSANRLLGHTQTAYTMLKEAIHLSEQSGYLFATLPTLNSLAHILVQQGKLHQAAELYQQVIERAGLLLTDNHEAHMHLSALYFEWNNLETAEAYLQPVLAEKKVSKKGQPFAYGSLILACIKQARGEFIQAQEILQQLIEQVQQERFPISLAELQAYQAWWALSTGKLEIMPNWQHSLDRNVPPLYAHERTYFILAHILITQGEPASAFHLVENWLAHARKNGRTGSELTFLVLSALALYAQGEMQQAQQTLLQALSLAQPEGYTRLFLQAGVAMLALLRTVHPRVSDPAIAAYIDTLLAAFAQEQPSESVLLRLVPTPSVLMEPLSQHEYRVLRLLVAGLSNPEIANELIISVNTVKTHVKNIYSKLNVTSRKEAREAARLHKLL